MIMEEDGEESPRTPFWVQSSRGRQFRISSIFLNSTILIIFLCLSAIFSILFIIPWFLSLTSQIFRPNLVKKTWDWLNAVLIILALIFGFLSRNKNTDDDRKLDEEDTTLSIANKSRSHFQWDHFSDEGTSNIGSYHYSSSFGLKRNSSSYPDLRDTTSILDHRRFLDDTHVENSRFVDPDQTPAKKDLTFESDGSKNIYIHTKTILKKEISHTPVPSPPPKRPSFPPSYNVEEKTDRALKQVTGHWENMIKNSSKQGSPPATAAQLPEKKKSNKSERKRSGGTATKDFINSFYHQSKKKKKQRSQSLDNFDSLLEQIPPSPPSPPPPPPPAKTSVFHNIISNKKRKPKKIISVPAPPPPPPPPLKIRTLKRVGKTQDDSSPATMGNESPLIPIPPPPPPPFKMPSWKFVVQGDYVRLGSFNSSISESSDADERESPMSDISIVESSGTHVTAAPAVVPENITAPALFCPSPDVNTKAEMFIAKFRAGLQLQKINSLEQKQRLGMSNLGPQAQDQAQSQAQLRNARK